MMLINANKTKKNLLTLSKALFLLSIQLTVNKGMIKYILILIKQQ